jgi:hypothetical protein
LLDHTLRRVSHSVPRQNAADAHSDA